MATFKKTAKKTGRTSKRAGATPDQGERLSKSLSESAQQVWLAGVGALGRAQSEGGKMFDALVKEGLGFEQTARKLAGGSAGQVRDAVETGVGQARERAADTWDRLEKVFEDRVQRAMTKLGVPGREELSELSRRVEGLTAELRRQDTGAGARKPATARKAGTTSRPRGAAAPRTKTVRQPVARKVASKARKAPAAPRKTTPRAPRRPGAS